MERKSRRGPIQERSISDGTCLPSGAAPDSVPDFDPRPSGAPPALPLEKVPVTPQGNYDIFNPGKEEGLSRPSRLHIEGGVYHVFNRLARGERVFSDDSEAGHFLKILGEIKERDGLTVFAWCLMGTHYHLALRVGKVPLDRPMRSLHQRITRGVNARQRVFGPLWQGSQL